jgi:hypothetical protein
MMRTITNLAAFTAALAFSWLALNPSNAHATPGNQEACEQGKAEYEAEGMTIDDCLCMLDEADKHMTPEMKAAFVESLLAKDANPMQRFMQLGIPLQEMMKAMEAYSIGVEKACGL